MEISSNLVEGVVLLAISGFGAGLSAWLWRLQSTVNALALKLAESHPTKEDVRLAVAEAMKPIEVQMALLTKVLTDRSMRG